MNLNLARVAREEARKNYHGNTSAAIGNLHPLAELFEMDGVTVDTLDGDWSGAFAYLCAMEAGIDLPIRYPDPRIGACFAYAGAWERYAKLPKIRLWHSREEEPEVGDLVVLDPGGEKPLQIGIILSVNEGSLETAEGNYHNHSALVERARDEKIRGYIRLEA